MGEERDSCDARQMFSKAEAYERFMGRWSRKIAGSFVAFAGVDAGDSVLDVGSGTGAVALAVCKDRSPVKVIGIDTAEDYVAHANLVIRDARAEFRVGNASNLDFPERTFEKTLSALVLPFVPDSTRAMSEMMRVTKHGGAIAAAVWDYAEGMEMLRAFWDEALALNPNAVADDESLLPLCREGDLRHLFTRAGLYDVKETTLVEELTFASFEDYWEPFTFGQGPAGVYVSRLSDDKKAKLEDRLRFRLAPTGSSGPIVMRARAWAARGVVP